MRAAARFSRSASATEVPPNFITTVCPGMRTEDRRRGVSRAFALAGLLMAIAAVVLFVVDPAGEDGPAGDRAPAGEAGSKFRADAEARRDVSVLEALRPVLGTQRADVPRGLPITRAAARVLAIGF